MALILNIETSTKICSVSLSLKGKTLAVVEELGQQYIHSEKLTLFIEDLFSKLNYSLNDLDAICVSKGPGSYTGLRIGVSCAKGLCYALSIPLISIDSLTILSAFFTKKNKVSDANAILYPMIDARRMEVFTLKKEEIVALILDENTFDNIEKPIYLFGDGANKLKELYKDKSNITIVPNFETSSVGMEKIGYQKFINKEWEDVAYFEPFYLKEFIAIPSKKKLL